jgi:DNA-binding transcriptional ArsR family regulator
MEDFRFDGCDAWIAAVDRALSRPDARRLLAASALDGGTVLAVARAEVSAASGAGVSTLSHGQLAQLTGLSRSTVLRARLALIELGLEDLASAPGAQGQVHRELRHR